MKKITINDFSGGIQESTVPDDFTSRQWAQLKGIIPSSDLNFESQWPIQTVGSSFTGVHAVYPLVATTGTYLVAIKTNGTIWWAKSPSTSVAYTTANAVSWAQITVAQNKDAAGNTINIQSNTDYKFVCTLPLKLYKYVTTPDPSDADNPSKDTVPAFTLAATSAVMLNSTTLNGSSDGAGQQVVVVFVDTVNDSCKAITFPNVRRIPLHDKEEGSFIKAYIGDDTYVSAPNWFTDTSPYRGMHPYLYLNIDAALLPGSGVIPRANIGATKGGTLLLGDIEWRSDLAIESPTTTSVPITSTTGLNEFANAEYLLQWPASVPNFSRVISILNGETVYFKDDANMVGTIVDYSLSSDVATFTTVEAHGFTAGETVEISRIGATYNGTYEVKSGPTTYTFEVDIDKPDSASPQKNVTNKEADGTKVIITATAHGFLEGNTVYVNSVDAALDGFYTISAVPTADTFEYLKAVTVASAACSGTAISPVGRAVCYDYINYVEEYQPIPNSWTDIYVTASVAETKLRAITNLNTATHLLSDANTGPHRNSIYFSTGADIDQFDPRGILSPGKTDVQVVGLHVLDDTIVVITTAGSQNDGVYRIRGYIDRLIQYGSASDPNAVRIELVRGGLGAPKRTSTNYKAYSTVWSEAGVVVFLDRLGGVWYTNGRDCDRLDRYGPKQPNGATENDHVAELGKNLFVWRNNRLLCLTMMDSSPDGRSGTACWTEVNVPSAVSSMVGANQELFFVMGTKVCRMTSFSPNSERATYDNSPLTITVSTLTAGDGSSHLRTNWHKFGMTFATPTSCTVGTVKIQSTGALNLSGPAVLPDVQYTNTLNRTFNNVGVLGEFIVNTGIGPQAMCSATITFTGFVQLQSASFWVTGATPRVGDL